MDLITDKLLASVFDPPHTWRTECCGDRVIKAYDFKDTGVAQLRSNARKFIRQVTLWPNCGTCGSYQ